MSYAFLKGHGTENDFVLLPDPDGAVHGDLSAARVRALCDRRAGIGGDGVLRVIRASAVPDAAGQDAEWFMDYRNADGSVAEMCGNGIRVFAHHLAAEELAPADGPIRIGTRSGVKTLTRSGDLWTADLGVARLLGETKVGVGDRSWPAQHVEVGNPHAVALVEDLGEVGSLVAEPAYDAGLFPEGVNVEFVVRRGEHHLAMRVHERGSGETRSCGTGVCAAAMAATAGAPGRVRVDVPGGRLEVSIADDGAVALTGPAVIVARGTTNL